MEMPEGWKTLNYLADNSLSVIIVNGYRLDQKFLKQTRDMVKEMYEALESVSEIEGPNDTRAWIKIWAAKQKFKEWK